MSSSYTTRKVVVAIWLAVGLVCIAEKLLQQGSVVWFWIGLHFEIIAFVAGLIFFLKTKSIRPKQAFWCVLIFSLLLTLSWRLPSRGLFAILIGLLPLLGVWVFRPETIRGWIIGGFLAIVIGISPAVYGIWTCHAVFGFFNQETTDISSIVFFRVGPYPYRTVGNTPDLVIRDAKKIQEIVRMLGTSYSKGDPRHVGFLYVMRISHRDGSYYEAVVGKIAPQLGMISLTSHRGVDGFEYGVYDNSELVAVLSRIGLVLSVPRVP